MIRFFTSFIGLLMLTLSLQGQVALKSGLVAHFPFDNSVGDISGNSNNATVSGFISVPNRLGENNKAIQLNNQFITLPSTIYSGKDFTISTWLKVQSFGRWGRIFDFGTPWFTNSSSGIRARTSDLSGGLAIELFNTSITATGFSISAKDSIKTNQWYHVAFTKSNNTYAIYLNGIQSGKDVSPFNTTTVSSTYANNYINNSNRTGIDSRSNISLDDYRIYNRALTELEIKAVFGDTLNVDLQNGLIATYPFNGNAKDESGHGYDATVSGATLVPDRNGKANSAYYFDGLSNIIKRDTFPVFFNNNFSISLWLKSAGDPGGQTYDSFISYGATQSLHSWGYAYDRANLNFSYYDVNNGSYYFNNGAANVKNSWAHVTIVYNNGVAYNYVNGILSDTRTVTSVSLSGAKALNIGAFIPDNQYFNGIIDDVNIYGRSLNFSEVLALYAGDTCASSYLNPTPVLVNSNNSLTVTIPKSVNQYTYAWSYNSIVQPSTSNPYSGSLKNGTYTVTVAPAILGCSNYKIFKSITLTNLTELDSPNQVDDEITLYPNPTFNNISIKSPLKEIGTIEIANLNGEMIQRGSNPSDVNLTSLPIGTYLLKIFSTDGKKLKTVKVVKE